MTSELGTATLRQRERILVLALLLMVAGLAWALTILQAMQMDAMEAAMWRDMNTCP